LPFVEGICSSVNKTCSAVERCLWTAGKICSPHDKTCSRANNICPWLKEFLPAVEQVLWKGQRVSVQVDKGSVSSEEQ